MSGIEINKPTKIDNYTLTASAAFSLRSIVGTNNAAIRSARVILARADDNRLLEGARFITESHIVRADAELFHEKLAHKERNAGRNDHIVRPGGSRSGRQRGAPIDDS